MTHVNLKFYVANLLVPVQTACKFYLHYCAIPMSFDLAYIHSDKIPPYFRDEDPAWMKANAPSLDVRKNLELARDNQRLAMDLLAKDDQSSPESAGGFRYAYRVFRRWAGEQGLFDPMLGFLDCGSLTRITRAVYLEYQSPLAKGNLSNDEGAHDERENPELYDMLSPVYEDLHEHKDCANIMYRIFERLESELHTKRKSGEDLPRGIDISGTNPKLLGTHVTGDAKEAISNALELVKKNEKLNPAVFCKGRGNFMDFLQDFSYFYKVEFECWEPSPAVQEGFKEHIVGDNIKAIATYLREKSEKGHLDGIYIRIWPIPYEEKASQGRIIYALGLGGLHSIPTKSEDWKTCVPAIVAQEMENMLQYDPLQCLITISLAKSVDLVTSYRQKADHLSNGSLPTFNDTILMPTGEKTTSSNTRFRTAGEAISRLRHDPAHATIEYELGYEDRHAGLVWIALEEWGGKPTEAEDFIPEHRVRKLKRQEDGVVVWDRENRVDLL